MAHRYILACFVFIFCWVDGESLYGLKGLSVSLKPAIPSEPADILWKHNGNKLVEFNGNEEHVYGKFANRITLDWHTAEIEITDLRFEDSGNYELEATINNMLHRSSKTLVVIDKVPKPTISCKMNDGSSSKKSGTLECSAESNHSQTQSLLKFEWESHGNVQPGPQLTISLGDEHDDHEYICNVSNPKSSETTTFTAKDCYPDESSSVALAVGLAIPFLIIFVVLGIACYRKRKVRGDDEESPPGSTKKVSDNHNMTAQVKESEPLLPLPAANQPPGMTGLDVTTALGDGNSQNVDEAYQQVPVKERIKMFGGKKDGKMNKGKAPPVPPRGALSPEPAKKEDPADEPADLEEDKMSHQESSAAPEEPGLETTLSQSELKKEAEKDGEANVPSDSVFPAKALSPLTQNCPNVAPENAAGEQSEDMDKPISTPEKEPANEEIDKEKDLSHQESSAAPEEPGLETTLSQSGSDQTTAQAEENSTPTDEAAANPPPDMTTGGKMNEGKAPLVPPCSELSLESAKKEDPQSDPSVSEKANEPDQADESAEEDKMSESSSTAPEESGSDQTTAQAEENSTPTDEAATDQQPDRKKGYVNTVKRRFE